MIPNSASDKTYSISEGIAPQAKHTVVDSDVESNVLHAANVRHDGAESQDGDRTLSPTVTPEPSLTAKPCGCVGACTATCRNDRAALARAARLMASPMRQDSASARPGDQAVPRLKPSALAILGLLQKRPATNRELINAAGFRYSARVYELRRAGHVITVTAPGPTPGVRLYRLEPPVDLRGQPIAPGRGGKEVAIGEPPPGADVLDSDMEAL